MSDKTNNTKRGRKPLFDEEMIRATASLPASAYAYILDAGEGSFSAGVRELRAFHEAHSPLVNQAPEPA